MPFYPPNSQQNQNFEKMKKTPGVIITLHMCIINDNHVMYGSWNMKCERHNFLSFCAIFYLEISSFCISVPKIMIRWCTFPDIWCVTDVIKSHFGLFFTLPPSPHPNSPKKSKFWKNEKKCPEISSFYICVLQIMIRWYTFLEIWCMTDVIISHFGLFFPLLPL